MDYNIQTLEGVTQCVMVKPYHVIAVSKLDAASLATDVAKYTHANKLAYYTLLNVWGNMIVSDVSEEAWYYIWLQVQQRGLIPVIRDCSALADVLIHSGPNYWVERDNINCTLLAGYLRCLVASEDHSYKHLANVLELLRFPKRFSPVNADVVTSDSITAFFAVNQEVKRHQRSELNQWWIRRVRYRISLMLRGYSKDCQPSLGSFSNGSTAGKQVLLASKLKQYSKEYSSLYGSPMYPISVNNREIPRFADTLRPAIAVRLTAVPKTYKVARVIAMEPANTGFYLQSHMRALRSAIKRNKYQYFVDTKDQTVSRRLCQEGSVDGSYATIDLSAASDRISESLIREVFPHDVVHMWDPYRPAYISKAGKPDVLMHMFATSGSPLTFDVQSILFSAIAQEVTATVERFSGEKLQKPRQFGDDAVVDSRAAMLFMEVLELFGGKPNYEKSFVGVTSGSDDYYREACGVEYLNGYPMHSKYFPRKSLELNPEGIQAICDLQHRVYKYWKARVFLTYLVKAFEPNMTSHVQGSDCSDLWDEMRIAPDVQFKGNQNPAATRYKHSVLISKYPILDKNADVQLLDLWFYTQYLIYGPNYNSDLDQLLRVSTSRKQYTQALNEPALLWRTILE